MRRLGMREIVKLAMLSIMTVCLMGATTPSCEDLDGDGVLNEDDLCPETPADEIVNNDGCSVDQLCPCDDPWKNHGGYVSCVAHAAEGLVSEGKITGEDKGAIVSAGAQSSCGKK